MRNDLILVFGILAVIFVLWVYTGGPNRPISFAGPYLTPLTSPTNGLEPYGGASFFGMPDWNGGGDAYGPVSDTGAIRLGGGNATASDTDEEYLTLFNDSGEPVSITGWRLVSERSGASVTIPSGERLLRESGRGDIVLFPGEEAVVVTGDSPVRASFAETRCTGYLENIRGDRFYPSLNNGCYTPLDELERYYGGNARNYDRCAEYVSSLPSCREARSIPRNIPESCEDFVDDRLSYNGCVDVHSGEADFFTGTWRVFLGEGRQLWRSSGESILLIDLAGNVVDRYTY